VKPAHLPLIAVLGTFIGAHAATYKVETKYLIGGTEGWDYIAVDSAVRRDAETEEDGEGRNLRGLGSQQETEPFTEAA
jgi:hypothetical protein